MIIKPTLELRWIKRYLMMGMNPMFRLQQKWVKENGEEEWKDIPEFFEN